MKMMNTWLQVLQEASVDSTTCEIEGIVLGLEMSVQYYKERIQKGKQEVVQAYILSDCTAAIDMVIHRSRFLKMPDLYNRLKRVQDSLSDLNISACIIIIIIYCENRTQSTDKK